MLKSLPLERIYRDSRCGSLMLPWTAELLSRPQSAAKRCTRPARRTTSSKMDLSDLIERNAAFTPDKPATIFEGETLNYTAFNSRIVQTARALKSECGVGRGDRVAILSLNRPDYLVLLYACARLGAMLVPLNWRLAVAEQVFILSDASVKVLVLEQAFAHVLPVLENSLPDTSTSSGSISNRHEEPHSMRCWRRARGDGRNPHHRSDLSAADRLHLGHHGKAQGCRTAAGGIAVERGDEQHMHGLTSDDHVLTVLPFFHVGGLNIQTTPALHQGATVTIHSRFTPDTTLETIAREPPDLDGAGARHHSGGERPSRLGHDRSVLAESGLDRIDHRAAASGRPLCRARGAGAAGLWFD